MRQPTLRVAFNGASVAVRGLLEISLFVVERSAINQRVRSVRILPQDIFVSVDGLRPGLAVCAVRFVVERQRKPLVGAALGNDLDFFIQLARLEIHHKLAGQRFQARTLPLHDDVLAIGKDAQLGQRRLHLRKFFAQRRERASQAAGGNARFDQLLYGAQGDEVAKVVEAAALIFPRGDQLEAVPVIQLFWRQTQDTLDFVAAESVRGAHEKFSVLLFSTRRLSSPSSAQPSDPPRWLARPRALAASSRALAARPDSSSALPSGRLPAPYAVAAPRSLPGP